MGTRDFNCSSMQMTYGSCWRQSEGKAGSTRNALPERKKFQNKYMRRSAILTKKVSR
jgi:hypothetical protein